MVEDPLTLVFCVLTLGVAGVCVLLHVSPTWALLPAAAAIACYMRRPFHGLLEMFFGGRR